MAKPGSISAKPLSVLLRDVFSDAYAKQGFAARELVTRWADIAGPEIAAHSEPLKMQWPRPVEGQPQEPATLILRVEGPMALEIQHSSDVILQRVNRFFGWSAVGRLALRQAPLSRRNRPTPSRAPDPKSVADVAETLSAVEDQELRAAPAPPRIARPSPKKYFRRSSRNSSTAARSVSCSANSRSTSRPLRARCWRAASPRTTRRNFLPSSTCCSSSRTTGW